MDGFLAGKMKRKDLDEIHDDFAEFSLLSPARKIRRLDVELPSIVEEDDLSVPVALGSQSMDEMAPSMSWGLGFGNVASQTIPDSGSSSAERALLLYKPVENPLLLSPGDPHVSFTVNSDFIHGLKNHLFKLADQDFVEVGEKSASTNNCLAVVPWVPSDQSSGFSGSELKSKLLEEPMDYDEPEAASMEVEEPEEHDPQNVASNERIQQWQQQQHWLMPNSPGPVMWS